MRRSSGQEVPALPRNPGKTDSFGCESKVSLPGTLLNELSVLKEIVSLEGELPIMMKMGIWSHQGSKNSARLRWDTAHKGHGAGWRVSQLLDGLFSGWWIGACAMTKHS